MAWGDDEWAELHGYVHMRCSHCGWSGKTDGMVPECGCHDAEDEDAEPEPELGICRTATHTARKYYNTGTKWDIEIRPGDTYRRTVTRHYIPGGEWLRWELRRTRLAKGPAWDEHTVVPKDDWDTAPLAQQAVG